MKIISLTESELIHFFWEAAAHMELVDDIGTCKWKNRQQGTILASQEWLYEHDQFWLGEFGTFVEDALDVISKSTKKC